MITEVIVAVGMMIAEWFVGLFSTDWEVPTEIVAFDETVNAFIGDFGGLGVWAPWPLLISCVVICVTVWTVGIILKASRALAAHVPFFGGAG